MSRQSLDVPVETSGITVTSETITASRTLSAAESGKTFFIGTDALVITLPTATASTNVEYTFINSGADGAAIITISPDSAAGIWGTITLAGSVVDLGGVDDKDLINTKATSITGDSATIICNGVDWFVKSSTGIWAAEA